MMKRNLFTILSHPSFSSPPFPYYGKGGEASPETIFIQPSDGRGGMGW
jgi:hypothetical protein